MIAEQGRSFLERYGAVLVGVLAACEQALDPDVDAEAKTPSLTWDEARDERNGLVLLDRRAWRRDLDLRHLPRP